MVQKVIFTGLAFLVLASTPVLAQSKKKTKSKSFSEYVNDAKTSLERVGHQLGDAIGFDDRLKGENSDEIKVNGKFYMPLYTVSLYQGSDVEAFKDSCRHIFMNKYPQAKISSVTLPQEGWISESVKDNNNIIGYLQTLYCYIIAKDGNDGYINARFAFKRYKDVGKDFGTVEGSWPKWERTDVLTNSTYNELLTK